MGADGRRDGGADVHLQRALRDRRGARIPGVPAGHGAPRLPAAAGRGAAARGVAHPLPGRGGGGSAVAVSAASSSRTSPLTPALSHEGRGGEGERIVTGGEATRRWRRP